jgi:hypothetical protein
VVPADLQTACDYIAAHVDPDGPDPDPHGGFERRGLTLARVGTMIVLRAQLDPEAGAALLTALDAAMAPPHGDDLRTPAQRRADALTTIINQVLGAGDLPTVHGVRPHLGILVTPETLLSHAPSNQAGDDDESRIRHLIGPDENTTHHPATGNGTPPSDRGVPDDEPPDVAHRQADPPLKVRPRPGSDAAQAWAALFEAGVFGLAGTGEVGLVR